MIPGDEGELRTVGTGPRIGREVAVAIEHLAAVARRAGQPHHGVFDIGRVGVVLAHRHKPAARQGRGVGIAVARRCHGLGLSALGQGVQPLVGEVGEPEHAVRHGVGAAAVFVHAGADIPGGVCQGPGLAVLERHGHDAAAVGGPAFQPVEPPVMHPEVQRIDRALDQALEGDRRGPGPAGGERLGHGDS